MDVPVFNAGSKGGRTIRALTIRLCRIGKKPLGILLTNAPAPLQPVLWGAVGALGVCVLRRGVLGGIPGRKPYFRARCAAVQEHPHE